MTKSVIFLPCRITPRPRAWLHSTLGRGAAFASKASPNRDIEMLVILLIRSPPPYGGAMPITPLQAQEGGHLSCPRRTLVTQPSARKGTPAASSVRLIFPNCFIRTFLVALKRLSVEKSLGYLSLLFLCEICSAWGPRACRAGPSPDRGEACVAFVLLLIRVVCA